MFVPETEDMLPRAAPKPSAPGEEIAKPTVPEISLLFGQTPPQLQQQQGVTQQQTVQQQQPIQQQQARQTPTFASWKKQMLPRVNFSPVLATELGPPPSTCSTSSGTTTPTEYAALSRPRTSVHDGTPLVQTGNPNIGYVEPLGHGHYHSDTYGAHAHRRSLDSRMSTICDVLTICAGTQTEAVKISPKTATLPAVAYTDLSNLVSKQDLGDVLSVLNLLRQEQQHLRHLCEALVQQQQRPLNSKKCQETGIQCDILTGNNNAKRFTPIIQDYIAEENEFAHAEEAQYNAVRALPQFNSPRATPPKAQSTGYRPNTPQALSMPQKVNANGNGPAPVLPKPNTEKSLVMNELALKYLPQQQLDELMQELRLAPGHNNKNIELPTTTTPFRQIDNLAQSPNDISNASYKYLKKYRLLPEEQICYKVQDHVQSPLQGRTQQQRPGSPLVSAGSPHQQQPHHQRMLDLEHIRNQPKLL